MSKDVLSKIRSNDVYKGLVRVLSDYRVEDYEVKDKRPHPCFIIRYCGVEREFEFPGTPRRRVNVKSYAAKLRRFLQDMQMESLEMEALQVVPSKIGQVHVPMNGSLLPQMDNGELTMSSREIAQLTKSSHDNVLKTVRRLVKEGIVSGNETPYVHPQNGQTYSEFHLDYRNTMVVVSGYSPELRARIIDRWMELEGTAVPPQPSRALTTAEMFLQTAQAMVEIEQRQSEQDSRIAAIGNQVQSIQDAHYIHPECPRTAEPITKIKDRIGKKYGLSYDVITYVLRESPYAPRTISIRNKHENANGAVYQAFYIKNVTDIFERFIRECKHVVGDFYEHPYIRGRFKMVLR